MDNTSQTLEKVNTLNLDFRQGNSNGSIRTHQFDFDGDGNEETIINFPCDGFIVIKNGDVLEQKEYHQFIPVHDDKENCWVEVNKESIMFYRNGELEWSETIRPRSFGIGFGRDYDDEFEFSKHDHMGYKRKQHKILTLFTYDHDGDGENEIIAFFVHGLCRVFKKNGTELKSFYLHRGRCETPHIIPAEIPGDKPCNGVIISINLRYRRQLHFWQKFAHESLAVLLSPGLMQKSSDIEIAGAHALNPGIFIDNEGRSVQVSQSGFTLLDDGDHDKTTQGAIDLSKPGPIFFTRLTHSKSKIEFRNGSKKAIWSSELPLENVDSIDGTASIIHPGQGLGSCVAVNLTTKSFIQEYAVEVTRGHTCVFSKQGQLIGTYSHPTNGYGFNNEAIHFGHSINGQPHILTLRDSCINVFALPSVKSFNGSQTPSSALLSRPPDITPLPTELWETSVRLIDNNE